jgi:hypothetical protein
MIAPALLLLMLAGDDQPPKKVAGPRVSYGAKIPVALDDQEDGPTEQQTLAELAKVRRIYVDILSGGDSALRIRDLLMSSIQASKLFIVTEDEEKADAVLKGAGRDDVFTDLFQSSDNINMHSQLSLPSFGNNTNSSGQAISSRTTTGIGAGENESHRIEERKHEAIATVRLVNRDGDVIWAATEESLGAKFVGASVDVVDKITKKLSSDFRKAKVQSRDTQSTATK